jgi:hypothetical protein
MRRSNQAIGRPKRTASLGELASETSDGHGSEPLFLHAIFFRLTDASVRTRFMEACKKYLSGHPGQVYFAIGPRAREINRDVSALGFDVAVTMVFASFADYRRYRESEPHREFITRTAGMSPEREVYDAHVEVVT